MCDTPRPPGPAVVRPRWGLLYGAAFSPLAALAVVEISAPPNVIRTLLRFVFAIGAFVMLFQGVKLLFSNWRLTLIQVLPAMWIWLALLDLKVHTFKGKEFMPGTGPSRCCCSSRSRW